MNYASIHYDDIANGLGVRISIFVSGCTHHCKGCFNEIAWPFDYGKVWDEKVENDIINATKANPLIHGLSLLGGEPFELVNQRGLIEFIRKYKALFPKKNIWAYSGYLFDSEIVNPEGRAHCEVTDELLSYIDVLVDGKFVLELKDVSLKFKGSSNQRLIDVKKSLKENKVILFDLEGATY